MQPVHLLGAATWVQSPECLTFFFCIFLVFFSSKQDLFFKYSWNNFLHFQVELCVAAILNHPSTEERPIPGLQNHDGKPAVADPEAEGQVQCQQEGQGEGQGEAVETGRTTDPQTSIHNALVAHVRSLLVHKSPKQGGHLLWLRF